MNEFQVTIQGIRKKKKFKKDEKEKVNILT